MNQIFIAPRSGAKSRVNFEKTIKSGYDIEKVIPFLNYKDREVLGGFSKLFIWGNIPGNKSKWDQLSEGDFVFFYQEKKLTWVGSFLYKIHNKKLADSLWEAENDKSFEYVFFLKDLTEVNIPLDIIINVSGYKPNFIVLGFLKLKNESVQQLINTHGSIINFINNYPPDTQHASPKTVEHITKENSELKTPKEIVKHVHEFITNSGLYYHYNEIANFYLSLKTKPFVILAGISGTGKTQLPRLFAEAVGMSKEQVIQVPVRPDWTDASDLIGYTALNGQFISKPLTDAILKAKENKTKPFFFILDEMNLARVEHYFSDFLSIIETRTHDDGKIITDPIITESQIKDAQNKEIFKNLHWPENLYLIGTVNMDETTHPFSRKVLDRANSIEMNTVELDWLEKKAETLNPLVDFTNDHLCGKLIGSKDLSDEDKIKTKNELNELKEINDILRIADLHFAYRVRDEIIFYATHAKNEDLLEENEALDFQFMQKILPRIHGSSIRTQKVLVGLINKFSGENLSIENPDMSIIQKNKESWFKKSKYPKSLEKLIFMLERFDEDRFTSFWV